MTPRDEARISELAKLIAEEKDAENWSFSQPSLNGYWRPRLGWDLIARSAPPLAKWWLRVYSCIPHNRTEL